MSSNSEQAGEGSRGTLFDGCCTDVGAMMPAAADGDVLSCCSSMLSSSSTLMMLVRPTRSLNECSSSAARSTSMSLPSPTAISFLIPLIPSRACEVEETSSLPCLCESSEPESGRDERSLRTCAESGRERELSFELAEMSRSIRDEVRGGWRFGVSDNESDDDDDESEMMVCVWARGGRETR